MRTGELLLKLEEAQLSLLLFLLFFGSPIRSHFYAHRLKNRQLPADGVDNDWVSAWAPYGYLLHQLSSGLWEPL